MPSASRLMPTQSSDQMLSRRVIEVLISDGFGIVALEREVEEAGVVADPHPGLLRHPVAVSGL